MIKVSVIIPVYKVESYLERCIRSVITQTYRNLEIILVDDGSPDNCGEICDEYANKDLRIKVIHKSNGGLSSARNAGLKVATGEYIAFVDSDDYIETEMIEKMVEAVIMNKADLCICSHNKVDEMGRIIQSQYISPIKNELLTAQQAMKKLVQPYYWYYVVAWNKLYRKELFSVLSFKEGKIHEDEFLIHHLFYKCKKICCIEDNLYNYVQRKGSIMSDSRNYSLKNLDYIESIIDRISFFIDIGEYEYAVTYLNCAVQDLFVAWNHLKDDKGKSRIKKLKKDIYNLYVILEKKRSFNFKLKIKYRVFACGNLYMFYLKARILLENKLDKTY